MKIGRWNARHSATVYVLSVVPSGLWLAGFAWRQAFGVAIAILFGCIAIVLASEDR